MFGSVYFRVTTITFQHFAVTRKISRKIQYITLECPPNLANYVAIMTFVFAGEATEGYPGGVEGGSGEETAHNVPGRGLHCPQAAKGRQRVGTYGRG